MHSRYIDEFLNLKSTPLLLPFFPNGKEITESFAAFNTVREHVRHTLNVQFNTPNVHVYVPCDGHSPRTASVFAVRTKWTVHSIDPQLRPLNVDIKRLFLHPTKMENFPDQAEKVALVVMVHPHVSVRTTLQKFRNCEKVAVIVMPCCFKIDILRKADIQYRDKSCWSEKNEISVYFLDGKDISVTM